MITFQIYTLEEPDPTAVVEIRELLSIRELVAGDLTKYLSNHMFHHNKVKMILSDLSPEEMEIVCNPNVTTFDCVAHATQKGIFTAYLERLPNVNIFLYRMYGDVSDLSSGLFNWKQSSKLRQLCITCGHRYVNNLIQSPELLFNFMRRQEESFYMMLGYWSDENLEISEEFLKYFSDTNERANNKRHLVFMNIIANSNSTRNFELNDLQ